jgi:hypothetical protein
LQLPKKHLAIFIFTPLILAGPWYVRTWLLTGNPFYSHPFFGLAVNPISAGILHFYRQYMGISQWTFSNWFDVIIYLLETATPQCTLGFVGIIILLRSSSKLDEVATLIAVTAIITLLWLYSIGETSGGPWYAIRVLSPVLVILSITSGVAFARWSSSRIIKTLWLYAAVCAFVAGWIYPLGALSLSPRYWLARGLVVWIHTSSVEKVAVQLTQINFPHSQQILSADAYLFVALMPNKYTVAPPWRPDLQFLFDPKITATKACDQLRALNIPAVEFDPNSLDTAFLDQHSNFFHQLYHNPRGFRPLVQIDNGGILLLPDAGK